MFTEQVEKARECLAGLDVEGFDADQVAEGMLAVAGLAEDVQLLRVLLEQKAAMLVEDETPVLDGTYTLKVTRSQSSYETWDHRAVFQALAEKLGGDIEAISGCLQRSAKWSSPAVRAAGLNPDLYRERTVTQKTKARLEPREQS
jgi:hypothetical protein